MKNKYKKLNDKQVNMKQKYIFKNVLMLCNEIYKKFDNYLS